MSKEAIVLIAAHLPLLYWLVLVDRFQMWNRIADGIEDWCFPSWFQWKHQGDKVSWVHHFLVVLIVSLWGGAWAGLLTPEGWCVGAAVAGWIGFVCFVVREGYGVAEHLAVSRFNMWTHPSPGRVGYAVDAIMDVVGPLLVAVAWTLAC